jgi:hypothetical protein
MISIVPGPLRRFGSIPRPQLSPAPVDISLVDFVDDEAVVVAVVAVDDIIAVVAAHRNWRNPD